MLGDLGVELIVSGANTDDMGDYRPGLRAASEHGVRHPLQECNLSKADVRALARAWGLPTWDKPASPCLSSRVAYGEDPTPERVQMIDQAEQWLRQRGLRVLRVRYHKGRPGPHRGLTRRSASPCRARTSRRTDQRRFASLGFKFVTLDLEGFRSGSMNSVIPVESLLRGVSRDHVEVSRG